MSPPLEVQILGWVPPRPTQPEEAEVTFWEPSSHQVCVVRGRPPATPCLHLMHGCHRLSSPVAARNSRSLGTPPEQKAGPCASIS